MQLVIPSEVSEHALLSSISELMPNGLKCYYIFVIWN